MYTGQKWAVITTFVMIFTCTSVCNIWYNIIIILIHSIFLISLCFRVQGSTYEKVRRSNKGRTIKPTLSLSMSNTTQLSYSTYQTQTGCYLFKFVSLCVTDSDRRLFCETFECLSVRAYKFVSYL